MKHTPNHVLRENEEGKKAERNIGDLFLHPEAQCTDLMSFRDEKKTVPNSPLSKEEGTHCKEKRGHTARKTKQEAGPQP
jgi:hypothetical protein